MNTDTNLLGKALIRLGFLILLFIISPIVITMSFKAIAKFTETPQLYFAYAFMIVGFLLIFFTIYFAFKTFEILQKAIFTNK